MTKKERPVILYPAVSEKVMTLMEQENKLVFVVDRASTKTQIKRAVEKEFEVKVAHVKTEITTKGEKHAIVRFAPEYSAEEIGMRLGIF